MCNGCWDFIKMLDLKLSNKIILLEMYVSCRLIKNQENFSEFGEKTPEILLIAGIWQVLIKSTAA